MQGNVKFVRIRGRVVPIKASPGGGSGVQKPANKPERPSAYKKKILFGAAIGAVTAVGGLGAAAAPLLSSELRRRGGVDPSTISKIMKVGAASELVRRAGVATSFGFGVYGTYDAIQAGRAAKSKKIRTGVKRYFGNHISEGVGHVIGSGLVYGGSLGAAVLARRFLKIK